MAGAPVVARWPHPRPEGGRLSATVISAATTALLLRERVRRLFPFGQRCFETAVYVYAASLAVPGELAFIASVADYGSARFLCT